MNQLKPCPFCGSTDLDFDDNGENNLWVYCNNCQEEGGIGVGKEEAIKVWNRRNDFKEKITQMLNEANESYIPGRPTEAYIRLDARIKALGDVLDLFE